ncbi:hypothetical protein [Actinoallomurus sp. NPDC050550]|uniref:hypothetical protein n=1 Tax=Actinoallomurus sp. NPDC050550 TaxID=3154937 RepID=UPI0033F8B8C4
MFLSILPITAAAAALTLPPLRALHRPNGIVAPSPRFRGGSVRWAPLSCSPWVPASFSRHCC